MQWISSLYVDRATQGVLRTTFTTAKPFPHLLIENFLIEQQARSLLLALRKEKFEEKDSDLFQFRQTQELRYSKQKVIKEFISLVTSKAFADFIHALSGLSLRAGSSDVFCSLYQDTDYLLCHDDQLEERKIAYVLYLSEEFNEIEGGALTLLDFDSVERPRRVVQRYSPGWNKFIMFEVSRKSWHAVEEVLSERKKRYAIGGWMY